MPRCNGHYTFGDRCCVMPNRLSPADREALRADEAAVAVHRADAGGPLLLICEHASAHIPVAYGNLGLDDTEITRHIGWDLGACELALRLADALDSPLVYATQSRLLMDLNREPAAVDSMPEDTDGTLVPGNRSLDAAEREHRRFWLYEPFHAAIDAVLQARLQRGVATTVVSIHSFTPVMNGHPRPWQVGVLSDRDRRLADALIAILAADSQLCVGDNQPYAPSDGIYHTIERHGQNHGLKCAMLEVRNDQLADDAGIQRWCETLAGALRQALRAFDPIQDGSGASGVGRASGGVR